MGFSMFSTQASPIAIDFGSSAVKLLQISPGERPRLVAAAEITLPDYARQGAEQRIAFLSEAIPNTLAAIHNSPNPGEAEQLINYLLSPQVERRLANRPCLVPQARSGQASPRTASVDVETRDVRRQAFATRRRLARRRTRSRWSRTWLIASPDSDVASTTRFAMSRSSSSR